MTEQAVAVEELEVELAGLRQTVEGAFDQFMTLYEASDAEFKPLAHQVRVSGRKVKPLSPQWLRRAVTYGRNTQKGFRFPQK